MASEMLVAFITGIRRELLPGANPSGRQAEDRSRPLHDWWSQYLGEENPDGLLLELAEDGERLPMVLYRVAEAHLRNSHITGTPERPLSREYEKMGAYLGRYCSSTIRKLLLRDLGIPQGPQLGSSQAPIP